MRSTREACARLVFWLLIALSASAAGAQEPPAAEPVAAPAVGTQRPDVQLPETTVRGERMERSMMDTATSVFVFDEQALELLPGLLTSRDLLLNIPNITTSGISNFAPAIRGVDGTGPAQGADAFFAGTRPRLNIQIDGRPASYNEVVFGDVPLWDVERVEVFRGPQSTLQGRNAIAGMMAIKTKDPTFTWEAGGRFIAGNYDLLHGAAYVSGPIIEDQLAFRLAFERRHLEHFVEYTPYPGVSDPEEIDFTSIRGKILFKPRDSDAFKTVLTVNHSDHTSPQADNVVRPFDDYKAAFPQMPLFQTRPTSGIMTNTLEVNEFITIENTLAVTDLYVQRLAIPGTGIAEIEATELLEEFRIHFNAMEGRLKGVAGLYVFHADQDETIDLFGGGAFKDKTTTLALFADLTYSILPNVDLILGGRLETEDRRRTGSDGPFVIDFAETYDVFLPKAGLAWHVTEDGTIGAVVARGYNGGGAGFTFQFPFVSYTFEPEYVWNYELYTRWRLFDDTVEVNANVFYSDYEDMQLPFDINPDPAVQSFVVRNADRVATYGAEAGVTWLAAPGLRLFTNVGLLQTEIRENPGSGIEGNDLARAPSVTANIGATYVHSSGFDFGVEARFSGSYYSDVLNDQRGKTDPYWVVNAQVGYTFLDGRVRAFAFITNLFDADDEVLIFPGATPAADTANILQPRTFGIGVQTSF